MGDLLPGRHMTGLQTLKQRRDRIFDAYAAGQTVGKIALAMGLSDSDVRRSIEQSVKLAAMQRASLAGQYVERELRGLELMEEALVNHAQSPDNLEGAFGLMLKVKERRAKYLGLDRPAEIRLTASLEDLLTAGSAAAAGAGGPSTGGGPEIGGASPPPHDQPGISTTNLELIDHTPVSQQQAPPPPSENFATASTELPPPTLPEKF